MEQTPEAGPSAHSNNTGQLSRSSEKAEMSTRKAAKSRISPSDITLDETALDKELALLYAQYLQDRHPRIANILNEELLGIKQSESRRAEADQIEKLILDGDYGDIETLLSKSGLLKPQAQKAFLYLCYRQQFLEHIENRESQKAFNLLQKRLKPLEHYQPVPYDFFNLAYLTSAGTVHDAPSFRHWAGSTPERERLVGMWKELVQGDATSFGREGASRYVPPERLRVLVKQAAAWQVMCARRRGRRPWHVVSLLEDYHIAALPTILKTTVKGHRANVKCVDIIDDNAEYAISGSSDSTLRIFSTITGKTQTILEGHTSRIWDCAINEYRNVIASGSADGTVRIWNTSFRNNEQDGDEEGEGDCQGVLEGDGGDVYSVKWRPGRNDQVVSGSYDKIIRIWDIEVGSQIRTFSGHQQSVFAVAFDHTGTLIASGSKDKHIRLWDAVGGVCVHTMPACLGKITSVNFDSEGKYLLAGCKDNTNRLWDLRMQRNLYRYTGHQNTSKNLIRCNFAQSDSIIIGGSEDGMVYLWEREGSENILRDNESSTLLSPNDSPSSSMKGRQATIKPHAFPPPPLTSPSAVSNPPRANPSATTAPPNAYAPIHVDSLEGGIAPIANKRSSPAYYPPKKIYGFGNTHNLINQAGGNIGSNVRPLHVLEGNTKGAVFDVRWRGGVMVSAGEDGGVGIWEVDENLEEEDLDDGEED